MVREEAARLLARLLDQVSGLDRTRIVADWATSDSWRQRATLAAALGRGAAMVGGPSALLSLSRDPYAEVRCAAARAISSRLADDPATYEPALEQLARDNRRSVRHAALSGLSRAGRFGRAEEVIAMLTPAIEDMDEESAPLALYAIRRAASHAPEQALRALQQLADHCDEFDEPVVRSLIAQVQVLARRSPERARGVLERLARHRVSWLRDYACDALQLVRAREASLGSSAETYEHERDERVVLPLHPLEHVLVRRRQAVRRFADGDERRGQAAESA
jgi:hypothetical protein